MKNPIRSIIVAVAIVALTGCAGFTPAQQAIVAKVSDRVTSAALDLAANYIRQQFDLGPNW